MVGMYDRKHLRRVLSWYYLVRCFARLDREAGGPEKTDGQYIASEGTTRYYY